MIEFIRGQLVGKTPSSVIVETAGVGYGISIPLSTFEQLPSLNSEVRILTHYHVREDAHKLYGFFTQGERDAFRALISISMVGPKVALSILSGVSVNDLVMAVKLQDDSRLRSISGVGPKTAQRLIMELKGKLDSLQTTTEEFQVPQGNGPEHVSTTAVKAEAYAAMISLGYVDKQVTAALSRVEKVIDPSAPIEHWITKALQVI